MDKTEKYRELWTLSFEMESIFMNLVSKDEEFRRKALPFLDSKIKKFNLLYSALKNETGSRIENIIKEAQVRSMPHPEPEVKPVCEIKNPEKDEADKMNIAEPDDEPVIETSLCQDSGPESKNNLSDKVQEEKKENDLVSDSDIAGEQKYPSPSVGNSGYSSRKPLAHFLTLNDRFLYTRELFGGSGEQYLQALSLIESMTDYNTVKSYFLEEMGWDEEKPEVKMFLETVGHYFSE